MWSNKGQSQGLLPGRQTVGPLILMVVPPIAALLFVHTNYALNGSLSELWHQLQQDAIGTIKASFYPPTVESTRFLLIFAAFEILLQLYMPGKFFKGPTTPAGHVPTYKANGFQSFVATLAAFFLGSELGFGFFKLTIIWDVYPQIISTMCIFSFIFCAFLFVKGLYFPSGPDSGSSGNFVMDYYWGTELYPRIGNWDVKLFTNCRFGLMLWVLAPISFAAAQKEILGHVTYGMMVNVALQLVYLSKVSILQRISSCTCLACVLYECGAVLLVGNRIFIQH
jgi:7-dehydrocholesterol reductase